MQVLGDNMIYFGNYTALGNEICAIPAELPGTETKDANPSSFLINRIDIDAEKNADKPFTDIYTPNLTGKDSIFSGFTAGCLFMPILMKFKVIRQV